MKQYYYRTWDDPIEVTVFNLFKVFVLVWVEVGKVKKAKMKSLHNKGQDHMTGHMIGHMTWYLGDGCKAVLKCEVVRAPASRGISEGREWMTEGWAQQTQHLLRSATLVDDLEREREIKVAQSSLCSICYHIAADEIGSICSLATVKTGIVNDLLGSLCLHEECVCVCVCVRCACVCVREREKIFMTIMMIKHGS